MTFLRIRLSQSITPPERFPRRRAVRRPAGCGATGSTSAATAQALAIAQRHDLPEMLARVLAGRGVDVDAVADFPRSDHPQAVARSAQRHRHGDGGVAHRRCRQRAREGRDLRRLRRRRRDLGGAARLVSAPCRPRSADPYSRPHFRRLRPEYRSRARAGRQGRDAAGHRRLRHHQHRAAGRGEKARHGGDRHRPPSMRRRTAGRRCAGQSEPARRSLASSAISPPSASSSSRWSRSTARCASAASGPTRCRSPTCCRCCIMSRSAPSPTSRR